MTEKEAALHIVRAVAKISSGFNNADSLFDNHPEWFKGKLRQDVLNFNNWFDGYTHRLMTNLNTTKEDLVQAVWEKLDGSNFYSFDSLTQKEMTFFLAKLSSALKNLKSASESWRYRDYLKSMISRAENLLSRGHIERLGILNDTRFLELVEYFDNLGNELIPSE